MEQEGTALRDFMVNVQFEYMGEDYEVTSTTLEGVERRVYNHTKKQSELLPAYLKVNPKTR